MGTTSNVVANHLTPPLLNTTNLNTPLLFSTIFMEEFYDSIENSKSLQLHPKTTKLTSKDLHPLKMTEKFVRNDDSHS